MTSTTSDFASAAGFIADYASWLWGCGSTCLRLEKNLRRIADAYGCDLELSAMPRHLCIMLADRTDGTRQVLVCKARKCGADFTLNTELSSLSWTIADRHISVAEATRRLEEITSRRHYGAAGVLLLASMANASFCRLFGGDAQAMLTVFFATMAGLRLKQTLVSSGIDLRVAFIACAFLSTVISCGATIFGWGSTPLIATATSVLYLVPGVAYINAASDFLDSHYLCSLGRFADAAVLTACLALGLVAGINIMNINFTW